MLLYLEISKDSAKTMLVQPSTSPLLAVHWL